MPTTNSFTTQSALETCRAAVASLCHKDRARLNKQIVSIEKRVAQDLPASQKLSQLVDEVHALSEQLRAKQQNIPEITFPDNLPVSGKREDISGAILNHQVVIVSGETGSGKTTQIPKICLALGFGISGKIGHTQPRRIAARTVASRIAEELNVELGSLVGYQVRFADHSSDQTAIKLMTDGILLAEIQSDPLLLNYDVIIIDEAHERSLNIDFLLGYLKIILPRRQDLKVIVTSATIDVDRFSQHFNDAPIIEVSGRTFPVEVRYRPWQQESDELSDAIVATAEEILHESRGLGGDILVFLSGEREILDVSRAIKKAQIMGLEVLPLYARLSLAEQNRIFQPHKGRRIILATNVAETSVTVPGIRYVIDSGMARISRYSLRTKVQRLPIETISKASANQRKGRCGRVSDGICYRLYDEDDFNTRSDFTDPELLRTNLAAVVLQMLQLNMGKVEAFPFVDKPDSRLINDGYKLLEELQAVDDRGHITKLGKMFHRLSLDPRFARMVIEADALGCVNEVLIIVAALTIQDSRERPADKQQASDEKHRRFWHEQSDFLAYVKLWQYVEEQRQDLSQNQMRKLCKAEYLNFLRLREWRELHYQLKLQIKDLGFKLNTEPASFELVHQALLVGVLSNIGKKNEEENTRDYLGTRSRKFTVFPGSSLRKKKLPWLMAADFIETSQLYAHCVAKIDPSWVLKSASHLVKKTYFEPHFDVKSGSVKSFVKITLWGLVLVEKKRVDYSHVDPVVCRKIFIRSALVEGAYRGKGAFFKYNQKLIDHITHLEAKARRRDILVDDEQIFNFYNTRIPETVINLAGFEHWRKKIEQEQQHLLNLDTSRLMLHDANDISDGQFPEHIANGDMLLSVRYEFEPNRVNDGMNIIVPVDLLHQIEPFQLEWLVPGLLQEKCISLVKTLPKAIRKYLVPVPSFVDRAMVKLSPCNRPLIECLAEQLCFLAKVNISIDDWQIDKLEPYYFANIVVVDENNKTINQSRDLIGLREQYREQVQSTLQDIGSDVERSDINRWDFGALPISVELKKGAVKVKAYPALVSKPKSKEVDIKLFDNPIDAAIETHKGVCILALNELGQTVKYARKELLRGKDMGLSMVNMGTKGDVVEDILLASIRRACFNSPVAIEAMDKKQFLEAISQGRSDIVEFTKEYERIILACLTKVVAIKKAIKSSKNALAMALPYGDIQQQVDSLLTQSILFETPWLWVQQFPRYLDAALVRIEKAPQKPQLDRVAMNSVHVLASGHEDRLSRVGKAEYLLSDDWQTYRWMLEEFRVSLFAQTLKTYIPVSEKRLKKQWSLV